MTSSVIGIRFSLFILVLVLLILVFGYSRFMPADGSFRVQGSLVNSVGQPIEGCTADLLSSKGQSLVSARPVSSDLETSFVVASYRSIYELRITCPGYKPFITVVDYGGITSPDKPLQLGKVVFHKKE